MTAAIATRSTIHLAVAASFAFVWGCGSSKKTTVTPTLAFVTPTSGQQITLQDDVSAALDGIQIDVKVAAKNVPPAGVVSLQAGDAQVQTAVVDGVAAFSAFTIPIGTTTLTATSGTAQAQVTVTAVASGAVCTFVSPQDGDKLTTADDADLAAAGFQIDVVVQCNGISAGGQVQVGLQNRRPHIVTLGTDGRGTLTKFELAEGTNVLSITADALAQPVQANVSVDTGHCQLSIAPPDGSVVLFDAALDSSLGTVSATRTIVVTTTCAVGSAVTLTVSGSTFDSTSCSVPATASLTAAVSADGTASFANAKLFQGAVTLGASVVEPSTTQPKSGLALPNQLTVDTVPPRIAFVFPDTGLGTDVTDSDPAAAGAQTTLHGQVIGVEAGTLIQITVTDANGIATYTAPVVLTAAASCFDQTSAVGTFTTSTLTLADGTVDILYTVTDAAGNHTSHDASLIVSAEQPTLTITSPASGALLTGDAITAGGADVDPVTPGLQVDVTVAVANATLTGRPGAILVNGQGATSFTYTTAPQKVRVTLADATSTTLIANVTLANGAIVSSAPVTISVDATAPILVLESPTDGTSLAPTATKDVTVLVTGAVVVRLFKGSTLVATQSTTAAMQSVTFSAASVSPGANVFIVEAADRTSAPANTSTAALHLFVGNGMAVATFTAVNGLTGTQLRPTDVTPAILPTGSFTSGYNVTASAHVTGAAGPANVTVTVLAADLAQPIYSFTQYITIPATGALDITNLSFTLPSGEGHAILDLSVTDVLNDKSPGVGLGDDQVTVQVPGATLGQAVAITGPTYATRTNANTLPFTLQATTSLPDTSCDLQLDADSGGTVSTNAATLSGHSASGSADISSLSDGLHSLLVTCGGAVSQRQVFDLRRTASILSFADAKGVSLFSQQGSYVNAKASDVSSAAGLQINVSVTSNLPDGTQVSLAVTPIAADDTTPSTTATTYGPVTLVAGHATFNAVTLALGLSPNGVAAQLVASAPDPFAGGFDSVTRAPIIDLQVPTLSTVCPATVTINNSFDQPGTRAIEDAFSYVTSAGPGVITTATTSPQGTVNTQTTFSSSPVSVNLAFPIATPAASYVATVTSTVADQAQNTASYTCTPTIDPSTPSVSFYTAHHAFGDPSQPTTLNASDDENVGTAGLQVTVQLFAQNVGSGAVVHLCSTSNTLSSANATACTVAANGFIIGTGTVQSAGSQLIGTINNVSLADGNYNLVAEIADGSTGKSGTSASFGVIVDTTLPPAIASVSASAANSLTNDDAVALRIGANVTKPAGVTGSECDQIHGTGPSATCDQALTFALSTSPAVIAGTVAALTSSQGLSLASTLGAGATQIIFSLPALAQGVQDFTLTLTTPDGNTSTVARRVIIDLVVPTLSISAPTADPYLCTSATGCAGGLSLVVGSSAVDDHDLGGGCVCLTTAAACLTATGACPATGALLPTSTSTSVAPTLALPEGASAVTGQVTDSVGNVGVASIVTYDVDTLVTVPAPTLAVAGCASSTQAAPCQLPGNQGSVVNGRFPISNTLFVTAPGISYNSDATQSACALLSDAGPGSDCTFAGQILERRVGDTAFRAVYHGSTKASGTSVSTAQSVDSLDGTLVPALDLASEWELVWDVVDQRGNHARSASVFVALPAGITGATLSFEKARDSGAPSQIGVAFSNGASFGVRNYDSSATGGSYKTDLGVEVDWLGTATAGSCVVLLFDGTQVATGTVGTSATTVSSLSGVNFPAAFTSPHVLEADLHSASCTGSIIASTTATGVTFTKSLPTITYDTTWMAAHGFGPAPSATISGAYTAGAIVSVAGAQDQNPALAGYQFGQPGAVTNADPPVLSVTNADGGTVTFSNDRPGHPVSGTTTASVSGATATVTASSALSLPSTADASGKVTTQLLVATACNTAGDCVSTTNGGLNAETSLPLKVDVDAPGAVVSSVCVGENDVPAGVSGPAAAEYTDDGVCTAACASPRSCSRALGKAVLSFTAPANNGTLDGPVASYQALVAIRDVDAPSTAECATFLRGLLPSELSKLAWLGAVATKSDGSAGIAAVGATQYLQLAGLALHQRYCFAVLASDFAGNTALIQSTTPTVRVLPWEPVGLTAAAPFTRSTTPSGRPDDSLDPALASFTSSFAPNAIAQVPDMDGDGFAEIAVGDPTANGFDGAVYIFSSRRTRAKNFAPRTTITAPAGSISLLGYSLAAGDFNSDGAGDLAIGALHALANGAQGSFRSGATYIYFGAGATAGSDPAVIQTATCTFSPVPSPGCPTAIVYGDADGLQIGSSLAAGAVSHSGAGPADLIVGAPGVSSPRGAAYVIRGGSAAFPSGTVSQTMLVDVSAAAPAYLTTVSQATTNAAQNTGLAVGTFLGVGDFNGDGIGDIFTNAEVDANGAWAYHFFQGGAGLFAASGPGLAFDETSSPLPASCVPTSNSALNTVGKIAPAVAGVSYDWAVYSNAGASASFVEGGASFFASRACDGAVTASAATVQTETQFGALLDPECNLCPTCGSSNALTQAVTTPLVNAQSGTAYGAAPFVDVTGDGRPEFIYSQPGSGSAPSRIFVISYSAPACSGTLEARVVSELTGNSSGAGLGALVVGSGTHAGTTPGIATAGLIDGAFGVWLFQ